MVILKPISRPQAHHDCKLPRAAHIITLAFENNKEV